jgi:death-on-curing family protein
MQYLSVHDIAWINSTLAGKALKFDYVTLEESMAAQYSYGDSTDVERQAANLLSTLVTKRPFAYGNTRTGFIAVTAFLDANGYAPKVDDSGAAEIVRQVAAGQRAAADAITELAAPAETALRPGVSLRSLVTHIFNAHAEAIKLLAAGDE